MKITEDMVIVFNQTLENLGCSFKLKYDENELTYKTETDLHRKQFMVTKGERD